MFRRTAWVTSVLLTGLSVTVGAQSPPDGRLVGTVRDTTGGAITGATIVIESPELIGGPMKTATGPDGHWHGPALPAGTYRVRASSPGLRPAVRDGVRLVAGLTLTLDFVLEVEGITEVQRVEAPAPMVDVTSAAAPDTLDRRFLLDLPTSRNVADLINLVPGVAGDMAFGGTKLSNGIYVDGVDTTEPSEQGPWLLFTQNWLDEVQVVGLGANAEFGQFTGVAAYAVVRSGANNLSGLGEYWTTRNGWVGNNTRQLSDELQQSFRSERIDDYWNVNGQVGGPLRHDRLWFFAGVDHTTNNRAPAGYAGPVLKEEDDTRVVAKLTAAAWTAGRFEGFVQDGRRRVRNAAIGPLVEPEAAGETRHPQFSWSGRGLFTLGPSVLLDLRYTGYDSPGGLGPQPPQSKEGPPGHYDLVTGVSSVNVLQYFRNDRTRHAVTATGTWYAADFLRRRHELKFGVEIERAREKTTLGYPGGRMYLDYAGEPYRAIVSDGATLTGDTSHLGAFVQDRFALSRNLTLLPGIRVDLFRGSTPEQAGVFATNPVSPRLGLAWDVRGDHRTVVRLHYGRYTDTAFAQAYLLTDQNDNRRIDPSIRHSRVDQVVLGAERQLFPSFSLQVQYIHRSFGDFMAYVRDGPVWMPIERRDPGPDGVPGTADDGDLFTVFSLANAAETTLLYTNPPDAWRRYDAVQVVAHKRYADRWQLQASYTWSRSTGTMRNGFHANSGIRTTGEGDPNALINGDERLGHDPTNEVKLVGTWNPAWLGGFTVGGVYRYMTGSPWGRTFVVRGLGQGAATIRAEPRGTHRVAAINNLDLRVEKLVPLGAGRTLGVSADIINLTNQGAPDSDWPEPVVTTSGPALGLPTFWRQPRQLRAAVRVTF
jgi:hypothetical protein